MFFFFGLDEQLENIKTSCFNRVYHQEANRQELMKLLFSHCQPQDLLAITL